jgi:hypothetical protein
VSPHPRRWFTERWRAVVAVIGVPPRVDPGRVGLTFVDVLFALVIGYALMPLSTWWKISLAGRMHLGVAVTLTLLSWIGYHNSANRPHWVIGFVNLPFALFLLDIAMVVTYAFAVFTAETITPGASVQASLLPEAWVVAVSFLLYALWDFANYRLKLFRPYEAAWNKAVKDGLLNERDTFPTDRKYRRHVTLAFFAISVISVLAAYLIEARYTPLPNAWTVIFDGWLIVVLFSYRVAKDWQYRLPRPTTA